jgi:hypothetical protein
MMCVSRVLKLSLNSVVNLRGDATAASTGQCDNFPAKLDLTHATYKARSARSDSLARSLVSYHSQTP